MVRFEPQGEGRGRPGGDGAARADEPTEKDRDTVTRQLGRRPRPFSRVSRRCRYGYPQVILTEPLHRRGHRWEVFPTVFWLTCPLLHRAISTLEAEGRIRRFEERIANDADFAARMERAHAAAAAHRVSLVPEELRRELEAARPREARALAETGIAGIRGRGGVKCLHAHFADFIGRGDNPVGQHVLHLLQERGVPLDGTDECWRFCRDEGDDADVPAVPDRRRSSGRRA